MEIDKTINHRISECNKLMQKDSSIDWLGFMEYQPL